MSTAPAGVPEPLPAAPPATSLYVHVPFCARVCPYCDFMKLAPRDARDPERYLDALSVEALWRLQSGTRFETIYVGGGTPLELPLASLERLVALISGLAAPGAEISFETNPGTTTPEALAMLAAGGVDRLSIGAQTFDDQRLRALGRLHGVEDIRRACEAARAAGIERLSLDLLYGIPGETLADLDRDLDALLDLEPGHVSAYCLAFEPGTPFGRAVSAGRLQPLPDDEEADQMLRVRDRLGAAGLLPYEISNFAGAAGVCRHNLATWRYGRYEALGPAAAAFVGWRRRTGARDLDRWLESQGREVDLEEEIDAPTAVVETLMLGLRLDEGLSVSQLRERTGQELDPGRRETLSRLASEDLVEWDGDRMTLTDRGRLLASQVTLDLFGDVG